MKLPALVLIALGLLGCGEPTEPVVTTKSALNLSAGTYYSSQRGLRNGVTVNADVLSTVTPAMSNGVSTFAVDSYAGTGSFMPYECKYQFLYYFSGNVYRNMAGSCWCPNAGWSYLPPNVFQWYQTPSNYAYMTSGSGTFTVCGNTWSSISGGVWPQ